MPDRESKYLVNGTYHAKVLAISEGRLISSYHSFDGKITKLTDSQRSHGNCCLFLSLFFCLSNTDTPSQTATGTIAIQVEDFNDNCPTLTTKLQTICIPLDSVTVAAKDEDLYPNGPPFDFSVIPEGTEGKWKVEHLNGEEKNDLLINLNLKLNHT